MSNASRRAAADEGSVNEAERIRRTYAEYREESGRGRLWGEQNAGNRSMVAERDALVERLLDERLVDRRSGARVLDLGCGPGMVLDGFVDNGFEAQCLVGVDLIVDRLIEARRGGSDLSLVAGNGMAVPLRSGSVDIACTYTVFSSIRDGEMAAGLARELGRVLRPGGLLVWYDLRRDNPRNPAVHGVKRSEIEHLFPGWDSHLEPVTLIPPLARRLGARTEAWYPRLARVRLLRTHLVGVLARP